MYTLKLDNVIAGSHYATSLGNPNCPCYKVIMEEICQYLFYLFLKIAFLLLLKICKTFLEY